MLRRTKGRRTISVVTALVVAGIFLLSTVTQGYALRPNSTATDEESANMFGYGFFSEPGRVLAHDKIFRAKAADAFAEGRAVQLLGHQAAETLENMAAEFLNKSGEIGITQEDVTERLNSAASFLDDVFDDAFIERVVTEIAQIDESQVQKESALEFLRMIKRIASIEDAASRAQEARRAIVDETRFVTFIFGEKGLDPYLFNVGNILSKEYRALVAHIGTHPYGGSENIEGGPRTIYTSLARIEGFLELAGEIIGAPHEMMRYQRGEIIGLYQEMMLHEFKDRAYGRHVDPSPEVIVKLNEINSEIDKRYKQITRSVEIEITEEGPVVISNDRVTIEKYRLIDDLGRKEVFAIHGSGKVHPEIPKGKQEVTVTIAKADVGSIGGHGTAPGAMLEAVAEIWMQAAERGEILDFFITRVGDDISVIVTHAKGKDDVNIHKLIWDGFSHGAVISKDLAYYGAGQDLLADSFSGNVRGAGPSVAEIVIKEQGSEVLIIGQADKTAPGAFNKGLWEILFSPNTTWRPLGPGEALNIKVGVLDFDYNNHAGRHIFFTKEDYDDAAWYLGFPDRYTIDNIIAANGEDMGAVTAQRVGIIAGEYVGKDDPMFIIRSQKRFPAVGEVSSAFLKGDYLVPGWMRGSNKGPFFPVALQEAKIGIYDGPPLLSMWSFNLTNGRLVGFYDLLAANPAVRYIQDRRAQRAVELLEEGFGPGSETGLRLGESEIEYQAAPKQKEARLKDRWEVYTPKDAKAAAEQQEADAIHDQVAQQVALEKSRNTAIILAQQTWGNKLAPFAETFAADIYHDLSAQVKEVNSDKQGRAYTILINHESLLKASPDGIMALQNLVEELGEGNVKLILHIARDDIALDEVNAILEADLAKINEINGGYTSISRDMFAAVVIGTNPEDVIRQVEEKIAGDLYQVIGPESYVNQYAGVIRVALDEAGEGQIASMSKALKLGVELVPTGRDITQDQLKQLDELFSVDAKGTFHVGPSDVADTIIASAEQYQLQVETEIRI